MKLLASLSLLLSTGATALPWADALLLHTSLVEEYVTYMESEEIKATANPHSTPEAIRLVNQALFAKQNAKHQQQRLKKAAKIDQLLKTYESDPILKQELKAQKKLTWKQIADSGSRALPEAPWDAWTEIKDLKSPACTLKMAEIRQFTEHQKALIQKNLPLTGKRLYKPVEDWKREKILCLIVANLAHPKPTQETSAHYLIQALLLQHEEWKNDPTLQVLQTVIYIENRRFAESLSVLHRLAGQHKRYQLPYRLIQRVYSIEEKGSGQVAIKGI